MTSDMHDMHKQTRKDFFFLSWNKQATDMYSHNVFTMLYIAVCDICSKYDQNLINPR